MATPAPFGPDDFAPVTAGATACDRLVELAETRRKDQGNWGWLLNDDLTFDLSLIAEFLQDAAKKGWFVQTNASTGLLELIEKIPLTGLDDGDAEEDDVLQWDGANWVPGRVFAATDYHDPDGGLTTVPAPNTGGLIKKAHGITVAGIGVPPRLFRVYLFNNTPDCGYGIGDIVDATGLIALETSGPADESTQAVQISADNENVNVTFRNCGAGTYRIFDKTTGVVGALAPASWYVKFFYPF